MLKKTDYQMKKKFLILVTYLIPLLLISSGCEKQEELFNACGVENTISDIDWLADIKSNYESNDDVSNSKIVLYQWNNESYFYVQKTISSTNDLPNQIYNCSGEAILKCGGNQPVNNCSTFFDEAIKIKTIWEKQL